MEGSGRDILQGSTHEFAWCKRVIISYSRTHVRTRDLPNYKQDCYTLRYGSPCLDGVSVAILVMAGTIIQKRVLDEYVMNMRIGLKLFRIRLIGYFCGFGDEALGSVTGNFPFHKMLHSLRL
jgi:hypothetical protein